METVVESYLKFLYAPEYQVAKTIRGSNIPIEHDNKIIKSYATVICFFISYIQLFT